jgi:hypothetical protein
MDAVREAENPSLNAILFRESYPQLSDIRRKCRRLLTGRPFWGKYNPGDYIWTFPRNLKEMRLAGKPALVICFFYPVVISTRRFRYIVSPRKKIAEPSRLVHCVVHSSGEDLR